MKELNYTSVNRILSKLSRDLGTTDFSVTDVIEWTGEALEAVQTVTALEEIVAFREVKNHQVTIPDGTNSIIQIARNNRWSADDTSSCTVDEIAATVSGCPEYDDDCDCSDFKYIPVDETGTPLFESDFYEYRPNINVLAEYINWTTAPRYAYNWSPVKLKTHSFFNSLVCTESGAEGLYQNCKDEYDIVADKILRFSFQEGYVGIALLRQKLDDNNYPMIPDHYSYTTAVVKYITMKLMEREFYKGRKGAEMRLKRADNDWQWYCKQAVNRGTMIRGIDEFENLLNQRNYVLPRLHRYNEFFGNLGKAEDRRFNDPNQRNHVRR